MSLLSHVGTGLGHVEGTSGRGTVSHRGTPVIDDGRCRVGGRGD